MAHLSNPLATTRQLLSRTASNSLPPELQDCIRFYTARLTQAAGILLQLPQDITAQAIVILHRYWLVDDIMSHEFSVCRILHSQSQLHKIKTFKMISILTSDTGRLSSINLPNSKNVRLPPLPQKHIKRLRLPPIHLFNPQLSNTQRYQTRSRDLLPHRK